MHRVMSLRFGVFELDSDRGELRRSGVHIRVQDQPLKILQELVRRRGEIVTREELRALIWEDTFVDYDAALNTAIKKLREALHDDADAPRFIETIARRGYRFVAPIEAIEAIEAPQHRAPSRKRFFLSLALAAVAITVLVSLIVGRREPQTIHSLVVLPFVNLTGRADNEYVADGMTESLISDLAHIPSLQVISRTSAMQYKSARKPLRAIASELGVEGVVEGAVLRFGDRVRIEVKLVDGARDALLWSEQYERGAQDLDALQRDVASALAAQLRTRMDSSPARPPDAEAHLLYLKGRYSLGEKRANAARDLFQRAIAKDPTYAAAYAGLAEAEMFSPAPDVSPYESLLKARAPAEKALALDPDLAEARVAQGLVKMFLDHDFSAAERELRRAIELQPGAAEPRHRYAQLLAALGRFEEALREARLSTELDPFSTLVIADYGRVFYFARRYDQAIAQYQRARSLDPHDQLSSWFLVHAYDRSGRHDLVIEEMRRHPLGPQAQAGLQELYARGGYPAVVRAWAGIEARNAAGARFVRSVGVAARFACVGETERAFEFLDRAYESHTRDLVYLAVEPQFDSIRGDPRFQEMLRKVGLVSR
jgi:TolB-like protein/DNA-binding winged helix-turn-helix (wHTH) protein/Tfp pilus assembly protein PilF